MPCEDGGEDTDEDTDTGILNTITPPTTNIEQASASSSASSSSTTVDQYFSTQDVGLILYGFKNTYLGTTQQLPEVSSTPSSCDLGGGGNTNNNHVSSLHRLLRGLADKMSVGPSMQSAQSISNAMYGLHNMSADVPGVYRVYSV